MNSSTHSVSDARRGVGVALGLTVLLGALLALFAWPAVNNAPRSLPIVVAGPGRAATQLETALNTADPGAFDVTVAPTARAAVDRITHHEAYGGFVVTSSGIQTLTASARSAAVAQLLTQVGSTAAAKHHLDASTDDVVPAPADDPRGTGIAASMLPVAIGSILIAVATTFLIRRRRDRSLTVAGFAVIGGLAMAAILQFWLGTIDGDYLANAGVLTLGIAAVAMTLLGLESLIGTGGIGVGVALMMLVGNALSGATTAPEMLPTGWGVIGQLLPIGATNTGLRATAFFSGHGATRALLVCAGWLLVGLVLQLVAFGLRRRRAALDPRTRTMTHTLAGSGSRA